MGYEGFQSSWAVQYPWYDGAYFFYDSPYLPYNWEIIGWGGKQLTEQ